MKRIPAFVPLLIITACSGAVHISPGELKTAMEGGKAVLVDIRSPDKYADGHIKGSINIDYHPATFLREMARFEKEREIILYCGTGLKTGNAAGELSRRGYKNLRILTDGFVGWEKAGLPVVK